MIDDSGIDGIDDNMVICGRCLRECMVMDMVEAPCKEDPAKLLGQPIGMYHCPECGSMLVAGIPHFRVCWWCKGELERAAAINAKADRKAAKAEKYKVLTKET